jgi:hypothetical protein
MIKEKTLEKNNTTEQLTPETNDTNKTLIDPMTKTTIDPMIKTIIIVKRNRPSQDKRDIKKNVPAADHTHTIAPSPTREAKKGPEEKTTTGSPTRIAQTT